MKDFIFDIIILIVNRFYAGDVGLDYIGEKMLGYRFLYTSQIFPYLLVCFYRQCCNVSNIFNIESINTWCNWFETAWRQDKIRWSYLIIFSHQTYSNITHPHKGQMLYLISALFLLKWNLLYIGNLKRACLALSWKEREKQRIILLCVTLLINPTGTSQHRVSFKRFGMALGWKEMYQTINCGQPFGTLASSTKTLKAELTQSIYFSIAYFQ